MTTLDNIMPTPAYIYYTYILSYRYDLARVTELFTNKENAIERLCELGRGCIVTVGNTVVYAKTML